MRILDIVFVYQLKDRRDLVWHSRTHRHEKGQAELTYFMGGSGTFNVLGRTYRIFDRALFVNTETNYHHVVADNLDRPLSFYAVLFELDGDEGGLMEICKEMERQGPTRMKDSLSLFFEEMRRKSNSGLALLERSSEHQLLELVYELPDYSMFSRYPNSNLHIDKALRIFQSHIADNLSLGQVAAKLGLSESYFIRIFQNNMRTTPMKYYTQLRIEAATGLLVSTSLSVKQIAYQLSYQSEFHFSKQFKQYKGMSPINYRKATCKNKTPIGQGPEP